MSYELLLAEKAKADALTRLARTAEGFFGLAIIASVTLAFRLILAAVFGG